ncbi:hypothetical protein TRICI_005425 [Trichomonascus ciferrii]|uniref:Zn(2)-C6 fungal-type domain-containing protein n=1 Tax=Trichomonascus ciferrii TaxID=44093 RepID=A0A642USW5_9ASCO|nr:hypothetical protein TRICI_005425 [Trichomonascus ciferrii]
MKRRCDMLYPSCSRCAKRGVPCVYSGTTSNPMALYMNQVMQQQQQQTQPQETVKAPASDPVPGTSTSSSSSTDSSPSTMLMMRTGTPMFVDNNDDPLAEVEALVNSATGFEISDDYAPNINFATFPQQPSGNLYSVLHNLTSSTALSTRHSLHSARPDYGLINASFRHFRVIGAAAGVEDHRAPSCGASSSSSKLAQGKGHGPQKENEREYWIQQALLLEAGTPPEAPGVDELMNAEPRRMTEIEVDFYISRMRQYPRMFVRTLSTPFIHHLQYGSGCELPKPLRLAYTLCSLGEVKNKSNEHVTHKEYEDIVDALLQFNYKGSIDDTLALAQALTLAQIVRLFGTSLRQSTAAERHLPLLLHLMDDLVDHHLMYADDADATWRGWVFHQCICRTVALAYFTICLYHSVRQYDHVKLLADLPMGMPYAMWAARNESEWLKARGQYSEYCTTFLSAKGLIERVSDYTNMCLESLILCSVHDGLEYVQQKLNLSLADHPEYVKYSS